MNIIVPKKQKQETLCLVLLMILCAVLEVCGISSVLPVLSALLNSDFMHENRYASWLCEILGINSYPTFVIVCIAVLFIIFLVKNILLVVENYYHSEFALRFQYDIRKKVFNTYLGKDYRYFLNCNSADVLKTLFDDVGKVYATFDGLLKIMANAIIFLFLLVSIFVMDWRLSIGLFSVVVIMFLLVTLAIRPVIRKYGDVANDAMQVRNKWIIQAVQGIKTVKSTQKESYFDRLVSESDLEYSKAEMNHSILSTLPKMIIEMLCVLSYIGLIAFFVLRGESMEMLIPKIGVIGMATLKIVPGVNIIISNVVSIQYRIPAIRRVAVLIEDETESESEGDFPEKYVRSISVTNLSFRYDDSTSVLENASIEIPVGKMIGVVGVSGEGKTTFVDILLGLLRPENGTIEVDGVDIYQNIRQWRKSIGYITQDVFLLDDSIMANVAIGVETEEINEELVWEVLERAQIADFVRGLPEGLHSMIGERGVRLSGGQCQRLGIARALYTNPQVLIFDEATSSLDTDTERAVVSAINSLYGRHTMIVIAHRSAALEQCDEVYRISNGRFERKGKNG